MRKIRTGRNLSEKLKKGIKLIQAVNRITGGFKINSDSFDSKLESKFESKSESKLESKE